MGALIKKVVSILITDYELITENEAYHNSYTLYDKKTGSEFTDVIEVDVLELPKLPPQGDGTELSNWLQFLRSKSEEEFSVVAQKSPQIQKAVGILMDLSADEQTCLLYEAHEKARMDEESRIRGAWSKGKIEGKLETARKMYKRGRPLGEIVEDTELPIETLKNEFGIAD